MIKFFRDMYEPIRTGDFDDSYILVATIIGAIIDITMLIFCIIVLGANPDDLKSGFLHDWAAGEYRYVAWIIIGVMVLSWILLISYNVILSNGTYNQPKSYAIASNIVYYMHHILNGSALIMLPIVFIGTCAMQFGKCIASIIEFVMHITEHIANFKNRSNAINATVKTNVHSTYSEYDNFLNPQKPSKPSKPYSRWC